MFQKTRQIVFLFLLTAAASLSVNAQFGNPNDPRNKEELPQSIKENIARERIKQEKKEFEQVLQRGEEALKLIEELDKSFAVNNTFSGEDIKKLERLEKIIKKIRDDLGGDDDDAISFGEGNSPTSMANAFKTLQEHSVKIVEELKKSTRYTISAVAIQSSNLLLKIVKYIRFRK